MNLLDRMCYDSGGYTVQEILSSFCKKILEIVDLVNKNEEICDESHTIIENIRNEVVPQLVEDIMKELQENGYFDNLVNVTLIENLRTELTTLLNQSITDYISRLDNVNVQLDNKMNLEAGKKAYIISGVIRNSGDGWDLIDDEGHNSINITSVIQDEDNKNIAVVYPSAIKVGNFNVSPDETLSRMNIRCGASVSLNKASIKCFTDFTGYFNGNGLIVSQKGTWFDGTYTFTPLADGTGFNLIYDGNDSSIRPTVQVTSYADTGMNTQEMRVKANSSTSIDFRAYGDLEGKLICDGATFTIETPCVADISFSYTNGVLDIRHLSGSTETEFNRFNNVQLTPFINDLSGEIVQPRVFDCTRNKIRIAFYDKTGTQITSATPLKNMSLMFTRPNLKVPQKIDKLGIWYFNCGSTILRPSKFISADGNLWITGTQQI